MKTLLTLIACTLFFGCSHKPKPVTIENRVTSDLERARQDTHRLDSLDAYYKAKARASSVPIVKPVTIYYGVSVDTVIEFTPLTVLVWQMLKSPEAKVTLDGYADTTGGTIYNQALSERRAAKAAMVLGAMGVDSSRIFWAGHGELPGELSKSRKTVITVKP